MHGEASAGLWSGAKLAAEHRDTLSYPEEPMPARFAGGASHTRAVVSDLDSDRIARAVDLHSGASGTSVLEYVGQGFLDDAVGRHVDSARQLRAFAVHGEADR
jgi:hypothetical protein